MTKRSNSLLKIKNFSQNATLYRNEFENRYKNDRSTHSSRFIWDYWHIENKYSHLRTPAEFLFSPKTYSLLLKELSGFGRKELGCHGLSKPWVSLYLDGSYQNLHTDAPHGVFAYVFSLTKWKSRKFTGGETLLAKNELIEYWEQPHSPRGKEMDDFFQEVEPEFNQLLLFDPRIPHAVKKVLGTRDPLEGRLVVHGWFAEPRPFMEGSLSRFKSLSQWLNDETKKWNSLSENFQEIKGVITFRLTFSATGEVKKCECITNTLIHLNAEFMKILLKEIRSLRAPRSKGESTFTLPLVFH